MATFGERIRLLRMENELSQEGLAKQFGLKNRSTVSNWEAGRISPDQSTIIELAKMFKVTTDYILGVSDNRGQSEFIKVTLKDGTVLNGSLEIFDGLSREAFDKVMKIAQGYKAQQEAEKELNI